MIKVYCGVKECKHFGNGLCQVEELHISKNNKKPAHTEETNCMSFESKLY
ncbi:MAG: hypothetical protein PWR10_1981 [Halanaerobiales bacterium]|nr:hypothetical protein [Halanaerobiales bacterium]